MSAGLLVITGTGTGVGKTIVTASIAALAQLAGQRVAVIKPAQTGVGPEEPGDLAVIEQLSGVRDLFEFSRFTAPLAPAAAARIAGQEPLRLKVAVDRIRELMPEFDLLLVEGAGGLLVNYDDGATIADLAVELAAPLVVVTQPALGTLNHTGLTLEALERRKLAVAGVVIGSWPLRPDLACRTNLTDLATICGQPLSGAIRQGAGALSREKFLLAAAAGLSPGLGGSFDAAHFYGQFEYRRHA